MSSFIDRLAIRGLKTGYRVAKVGNGLTEAVRRGNRHARDARPILRGRMVRELALGSAKRELALDADLKKMVANLERMDAELRKLGIAVALEQEDLAA